MGYGSEEALTVLSRLRWVLGGVGSVVGSVVVVVCVVVGVARRVRVASFGAWCVPRNLTGLSLSYNTSLFSDNDLK